MDNRQITRLIDKAQKRYSLDSWDGLCLAFSCIATPINSHSQTKSLLERISENCKVYSINNNFFKYSKGPLRLKAIRKSSIFKGFCSVHDKSIFAPIDNEPTIPINKYEIFLYLYRTVCFEQFNKALYLKRHIFSLNQIQKEKNFLEIQSHPKYLTWKSLTERQIENIDLFLKRDVMYIRSALEKMNNENNYDDMRYWIAFTDLLPIHLSTLINPLFDNYIPSAHDFQPLVAVNIVPLSNTSFICFCWSQEYSHFMNDFLSDLNRLGLEKIINIISFLESEDVSITPSFFDNLHQDLKDLLIKSITTSHTYNKYALWNDFPIILPVKVQSTLSDLQQSI